jgi:hypothetical protein
MCLKLVVAAYLVQRFGEAVFSPALVRALHERTNGNPLFLVTVVKEMVRQGSCASRPLAGSVWCTSRGRHGGHPQSLRHLIDQQLELLHPEERICLEVASVAGREFFGSSRGRRDRRPRGRDGNPVYGISAAGPICPGVWDRSMARWDDHSTLWLYA